MDDIHLTKVMGINDGKCKSRGTSVWRHSIPAILNVILAFPHGHQTVIKRVFSKMIHVGHSIRNLISDHIRDGFCNRKVWSRIYLF